MQRYLNAKTVGLAAVAGVAVIALFPAAIGYLPLLFLALCPLMMFFMHGHGGHAGHESSASTSAELGQYVCPMHPEIRSTFPGKCPRCGMDLEATQQATPGHH